MRAKLIKKGMIYSPAHGDIDFTVPLFDEFMIRAIPLQAVSSRPSSPRVDSLNLLHPTRASQESGLGD